MVLVGRIVKREEKSDEPLADIHYLIGVTAQNLGKEVGDMMDLVPMERLTSMRIPDWAMTRFRARFPGLSFTNEELRRQFAFWHKELLPKVLRTRRW
jgi:hypothetical protein